MSRDARAKVYVGDIGYGTTKEELEEKFSKYGPLRSVWIARKPPGFAFVEFEDMRDAEDAVSALRGVRINGRRARVEMSSGKPRFSGNRDRGPPPRGRPSYSDYRPQRRSRSRSRSLSRSLSPIRQRRSRSRS